MGALLILVSLLMVVGAVLCLGAMLRMWDDKTPPNTDA